MAEELDFEDLISQNIISNNVDSKVSIETKPIKDYELIYDKTGSSYQIKVKRAGKPADFAALDDDNKSSQSSDDDEEPLISVQKKMRLHQAPATCDECNQTFKNERGLKRHKHVHRVKRKYKTKAELKDISITNNEAPTRSDSDYEQHHNEHETTASPMVQLDVSTKTRHTRNSDLEMDSLPNHSCRIKCDDCGKMCSGERGLIVHRKTHNKKTWNCEECALTFDSIAKLEKHNELHLSPQYSWSEAGEMDDSEDGDGNPVQPQRKQFECLVCGRVCGSAIGLSRHMTTHKNKKGKNHSR